MASRAHVIRLTGGFHHSNPQRPHFAQDAWGPPPRIRPRDLLDQIPDFSAERWPARVLPTEAAPDEFQFSGGTVGQAGVSGRWRSLRHTLSLH